MPGTEACMTHEAAPGPSHRHGYPTLLTSLPGIPGAAATVVCQQVVMQPQYRAWMEAFGGATKHLVVNSRAAGRHPVLTSACSLQVGMLSNATGAERPRMQG